MKKPKEFFKSVSRPFRHAQTKTFARYWLDDLNESVRIVEVKDRDLKKLDIPANARSLFFFDRDVRPGQALTDAELFRKSYNHSPRHSFADKLLTQTEYSSLEKKEKDRLTCFINEHSNPDTYVAIDGDTARFVNIADAADSIILQRQTREQLWPLKIGKPNNSTKPGMGRQS